MSSSLSKQNDAHCLRTPPQRSKHVLRDDESPQGPLSMSYTGVQYGFLEVLAYKAQSRYARCWQLLLLVYTYIYNLRHTKNSMNFIKLYIIIHIMTLLGLVLGCTNSVGCRAHLASVIVQYCNSTMCRMKNIDYLYIFSRYWA